MNKTSKTKKTNNTITGTTTAEPVVVSPEILEVPEAPQTAATVEASAVENAPVVQPVVEPEPVRMVVPAADTPEVVAVAEPVPEAAPEVIAHEASGDYVEEGVTLSEIAVSEEAAADAPVQEKSGRKARGKGKSGKGEKNDKEKAEKREEKNRPAKKAKLVRDSFTMPENEYVLFEQLKKRLLAQGVAAKKSELMRAGIQLLASFDDAALQMAVQSVEVIKTGRPAKHGH